jgi:outer membrane protein
MRIFSIAAIAGLLATPLFAQETLTLDTAIEIALQKNTSAIYAKSDVRSRESSRLAEYGDLLPSVSASGSWNWTEQPAGSQMSENSYRASVGANMTIFDGLANYKTLSASGKELEGSRLDLERTRQEVAVEVIDAYYNLMNLQELKRVRAENLKWNSKNLELIQARADLGGASRADLYQQQVKVGNAELDLMRAENNYESAKSSFLYYLGLDVREDYVLEDPQSATLESDGVDTAYVNSLDLDELAERAYENRSDYLSQRLSVEALEERAGAAFGGHLPRLTGSASIGYSSTEVGELFDESTASAGLNLSIPIFSGWSVSDGVEQREIALSNGRVGLRDLERRVVRELQQTLLDLKLAAKSVEVSRKNVAAAEETRKLEQEKYSLGSTTLINLFLANADYVQAQTNLINARFEYLALQADLEFYLGELGR